MDKTHYKSKDYYLGEKLTYAGLNGNQLSGKKKQSISRYVIDILLNSKGFEDIRHEYEK